QHLLAIKDKSYRFTPSFIEGLKLEAGDIFIVRGPRQVGKTTAIKMMIQKLLVEEMKGESIFYLSCESLTSFRELQNILMAYLEKRKTETFLFLDEVSFVPSWQRAILFLANTGLLRKACLVLTGSNARDLKESSERLPGRRGKGKDISLFPLSLPEMKTLACFRDWKFQDLLKLYMEIGGFPRAIGEYISLGTVSDTTYEIYRNWIIGDASRYELRQETLKHILFRIAETLASRITWPKLIENSPVRSHETALQYVEHLQDTFLCHLHYCYDPDLQGPATQKARKIYFIDPLLYGLALSWKEGFSNILQEMKSRLEDKQFRGNLFEAVVVNHAARSYPQTFHWYSAKEKKEVDLVIKRVRELSLLEVKLTKAPPFQALGQAVSIITQESFAEFLNQRE
ncbi:MAG: ATP-binding protein, partial [Deltaproteobacteria bacterium]|nr:ATP-binding protein [Deltaproteobacteria bacterium]